MEARRPACSIAWIVLGLGLRLRLRLALTLTLTLTPTLTPTRTLTLTLTLTACSIAWIVCPVPSMLPHSPGRTSTTGADAGSDDGATAHARPSVPPSAVVQRSSVKSNVGALLSPYHMVCRWPPSSPPSHGVGQKPALPYRSCRTAAVWLASEPCDHFGTLGRQRWATSVARSRVTAALPRPASI